MAEDCRRLLDEATYDNLLATGYGRTLAEVAFGFSTVTEIKAYARGARTRSHRAAAPCSTSEGRTPRSSRSTVPAARSGSR